MKHLLVKDWMTKVVVTASLDTRMLDAHRLMRENKIRRMPVCKNDKVIGIVTKSDVRQAEPSDATTLNVWEINYLLAKLEVKDIMTHDVATIHEDATIKDAATIMYQQRIGALPVVDDKEKLAGIITESDIFRVLIAWFNEEVGLTS
ncbi:MAG: CBS domain-containing protein [Chloroflexi bacterium]|nr:CBS domain-containing protein [Chloroflexota bacterium]